MIEYAQAYPPPLNLIYFIYKFYALIKNSYIKSSNNPGNQTHSDDGKLGKI